mmetsp:Transcript_21215/g.42158  ORF Transcript_21215/g.42158 Transcript_21215/m.42158 type:complete len:221 (+) Transcript_21215:293-955(+)
MASLRTVVFFGSARNVIPPWGGDKRLGDRVLKHVVGVLKGRTAVKHEVTVFDPAEVFGEGGALASSGGELQTPHFFLGGKAPEAMNDMANTIKSADCFLVVSPEYNHTVPPALASLMGHFGGSNYANKISAIVTYSPGPYGGSRAAVALRPFLSELGCLPVSKLCCLSSPAEYLTTEGEPVDPEKPHRMLGQVPALFNQMEWAALAFKKHLEECGPPAAK